MAYQRHNKTYLNVKIGFGLSDRCDDPICRFT